MKKVLTVAAMAAVVLSSAACLGKGKAPPPAPVPAAIVTKG